MESNISFDHVQLMVMQELIKKSPVCVQTIWNKIGSALGICEAKVNLNTEIFVAMVMASFATADTVIVNRCVHEQGQQGKSKTL